MRQEQIVAVCGEKIFTQSGLKIALGPEQHRIGDFVWVSSQYVFGHDNAPGIRPTIYSFGNDGVLRLSPSTRECYFQPTSGAAIAIDLTSYFPSDDAVLEAHGYKLYYDEHYRYIVSYLNSGPDSVTIDKWTNGTHSQTVVSFGKTVPHISVEGYIGTDGCLHWYALYAPEAESEGIEPFIFSAVDSDGSDLMPAVTFPEPAINLAASGFTITGPFYAPDSVTDEIGLQESQTPNASVPKLGAITAYFAASGELFWKVTKHRIRHFTLHGEYPSLEQLSSPAPMYATAGQLMWGAGYTESIEWFWGNAATVAGYYYGGFSQEVTFCSNGTYSHASLGWTPANNDEYITYSEYSMHGNGLIGVAGIDSYPTTVDMEIMNTEPGVDPDQRPDEPLVLLPQSAIPTLF